MCRGESRRGSSFGDRVGVSILPTSAPNIQSPTPKLEIGSWALGVGSCLLRPHRHDRLDRGGTSRRRDSCEHGDQEGRPGSKCVDERLYPAERIPRGIHETNPCDRQQQPERDAWDNELERVAEHVTERWMRANGSSSANLCVRCRHTPCDINVGGFPMTGHDEELRLCRLEIARLTEENEILRLSSEGFGALAERLNRRLRPSAGADSSTAEGSRSPIRLAKPVSGRDSSIT